jgi:peptidoglycan/xylan/chitin deacetylase (PgdA/CDA1 family)
MYLVKSPYVLTEFSKKSITWKLKDNQKAIYLTFDDGPIPEVTPQVLKILAEYDAKATFFMVGENAQRYPDLLYQVEHEGHSVGNHTYKHLNGTKHRDFVYYKSIAEAKDFIDSTLFRPPFGRIRPRQINEIKKQYQIVLWSVLSGDFDVKISPQKCLSNVIKNTKSGSIIVFHDSLKAEERMIYALKGTLKHFSKLGYQFLAIKQK